jgi:hypothetical protein
MSVQAFVAHDQGKAHRADLARWNAIDQQTSAVRLDRDLNYANLALHRMPGTKKELKLYVLVVEGWIYQRDSTCMPTFRQNPPCVGTIHVTNPSARALHHPERIVCSVDARRRS